MSIAIKKFTLDESGAVTTDWVVMTAGAVGLGLASMGVVTGGVSNLAGDIRGQLSSGDWSMFDNGLMQLVSFNFTGGDATGWLGGAVRNMGGQLGELLVLGPGQAASFLLDIPEGTEQAIMEFDLVAGDSLDNSAQWGTDTATIMLNGVPVAIALAAGNSMTFEIPQIDGTTVEATVTIGEMALGGSGNWTDSVAGITITVAEPTEAIEFVIVSNANQGIGDEFWAIDNFEGSVSGSPGF